MVSKKFLKSGVALALTASIALLAGCPTPGTGPTPTATATADGGTTPTAAPTGTAAPTAAPTADGGTTAPTAGPTATNTTTPTDQTGNTTDIKERATFNGKVFDVDGTPLDNATVTATSIDPAVSWTGEAQKTVGGAYVFRNAPVGVRLAITATKEGFTTRTRTEVLKSNLTGDPDANKFDFSGIYAIQDEPQVTALRINGTTVDRPGNAGYQEGGVNIEESDRVFADTSVLERLFPFADVNAGVSGISRDKLEIEMTFSEPVNRASVENEFKLFSETTNDQSIDRVPNQFTVDRNYAGVTFTWSEDDTKVTIKADKPLYTTNDDDETRYTVSFQDPFEDKGGTDAEELQENGAFDPYGYFRFSTTEAADYATFSVQKDTVDPKLTSVSALDNRGDDDIIVLNFSEPMDVINVRAEGVDLIDDDDESGDDAANDKRVWNVERTEGGMTWSVATQLGYFDEDADIEERVVYSITRVNNNGDNPTALFAGEVDTGDAGETLEDNDTTTAAAQAGFQNARLSNDGRSVTLTFDDDAFDRNDRILVAIGNTIEGNDDGFDFDISANADADLEDPAGNEFSDSNETESSDVTINDSQQVVTAAG